MTKPTRTAFRLLILAVFAWMITTDAAATTTPATFAFRASVPSGRTGQRSVAVANHGNPGVRAVLFSSTVPLDEDAISDATTTSSSTMVGGTIAIAPKAMSTLEPNDDPSTFPSSSTAVVLNLNARSVTPELADAATSIFGASNVYITSSFAEATEAARSVVAGNYSLVVPVGGDGTLSGWINEMVDEVLRTTTDHGDGDDDVAAIVNASAPMTVEDAVRKLPAMGYIPMGTGNGLGYVVGCRIRSGGILGLRKKQRLDHATEVMARLKEAGEALERQRRGNTEEAEEEVRIVEMPMIEVMYHSEDALSQPKGDLCFFAGVGFDSLMLNDFKEIKAWSRRKKVFRRALGSVAGYVVALVVKTLPKSLWYGAHRIRVNVSTRDEEALWVDHRRGDFSERVVEDEGDANGANASSTSKPSTLLYSGTTGILAAGTSPFYGGGMRLFPYARLFPEKMHLRLGRISPLVGFWNIPQIFEGSYREKSEGDFGVIDFIGDDFEVEVRAKGSEGGGGSEDRGEEKEDSPTPGYPFQHSGESVGYLERFRLRVVKEPIRFVTFLERRVVVEDE